jgi:hypothetical protein
LASTPRSSTPLAASELANGTGVLKTAKLVGLGTGTVHRLKQSIAAAN